MWKLLMIASSTHYKQALTNCVKIFWKVCENLYFGKDVERCCVNECLMFNEIEWMSNVMDFDTCVANENVCLWNEFANEFVL